MAKRKLPFLKKSTITAIAAFLSYLIYQIGAPLPAPTKLPASDQPIQMYANQTQDDLTAIFVNAIRSAKQSVTLVMYSLLDAQVTQALREKSAEGIPVYIVCDAKASPGITTRLPQAQIVRRAGKGLTHQKIIVIDTKQIWLGSANMTTDSLRLHGNLVFGIENPSLAEALVAKIKSMNEHGDAAIPFMHRETVVGGQNVELWILPDDPNAVSRMIQLFRSAQKSIRVAMFTWTRVDFTQELIAAARRGVKVEAVIDRYSGKGASAKIVSLLVDANVSVGLSTGKGLLHHKFVYIDNQILVNGSANWTNSAFKLNDDCFIVLYPLTTEQQAKMNQLWQIIYKESQGPGATAPASTYRPSWEKKKKRRTPAYQEAA
jgi:phosphatidylserine/phosphatidylglycerophosphate/cardiolipin synthase-like enzyme